MTTHRNSADAHEETEATSRNGAAPGAAGAWAPSGAWQPTEPRDPVDPDEHAAPASFPDLRRAVEEPGEADDAQPPGHAWARRNGWADENGPVEPEAAESEDRPGRGGHSDAVPALGEPGYEGWRRPAAAEGGDAAQAAAAGWLVGAEPAKDGDAAVPPPEEGGPETRSAASSEDRTRDDSPDDAPHEGPAAGEDPESGRSAAGTGRHAAAPRRRPMPSARRLGDPDDPEGLAGWVGSLVDAVDEATAIAGRRTGSIPQVAPPEEADPPGVPTPAGEVPDGAAGSAYPPEPAVPLTDPADLAEWDTSGFAPSGLTDDDDYRPPTYDDWEAAPAVTRAELIARLDALARLVEIGGPDFAPELVVRARRVLDHAGARLRLSSEHTVVALAGGTGSGKSSLFNALCGLEFSRVGVTRPTTGSTHACMWGDNGAQGLLDWLGVPPRYRHSRVSELDKGDSELGGLILLDLPDHDSVRANHTVEADRLIGSVDLLVWVLDPQKYADAAVHHRYLAEMAGHGAVMVAVLNQVDRVDPDELEELLTDLRRLLESESGMHPRILTASAVTDHGIGEMRKLLRDTVSERRAAIDRIVADLDQVTTDYDEYSGGSVPTSVPDPVRAALVEALAEAGGVAAVSDATETAYEHRGSTLVGWPVARLFDRLRGDPLRAVQLDFLREDMRAGMEGPVGVQEAEVDSAVGAAAESVGGEFPEPWPRRMRAAARRHAAEMPAELGRAIADTIPSADSTPSWWKTVRILQYLLVVLAGLSAVWFGTVLTSSLAGGLTGVAALDRPVFIGFAAAVFAAALLVGWLTGFGCRNLVDVAASRRREQVESESGRRVRTIAAEWVVAPMEEELARYRDFGASLRAARGATESA